MAKKKKRRRVLAPRLEDYVQKMLGAMMSYSETVDYAMAEFDCDESTVKRAIARVRAQWKDAAGETVDERRARFLGELEYAWRSAMAAGDYRAVAVMAKTRADVEGIKAVKKVEHGGMIGLRPVAAMAPQDRDREIQLLLAKRQAALSGGSVIDVLEASAVTLDPDGLDEDTELVRVPKTASKLKRKKPKQQVH